MYRRNQSIIITVVTIVTLASKAAASSKGATTFSISSYFGGPKDPDVISLSSFDVRLGFPFRFWIGRRTG
ncbi:hypothetical protein OPV22_009411 [Ensete ventricosum]|uniref:Uncharacterized protein n=1 Tax=Ensete ventricosum TaxID=4639 RepID=A0AAV8RAP7_ENSVE|nr:hypothetical protein OPV22_009411 [Ensete ventricosum]